MENIINKLIEQPDKNLKINERFLVKNVDLRNDLDQIRLDLQQDDKEYKCLVMEKGYTFPIPAQNDILLVDTIYLKYSQEFQFKLYIKGKIDKNNKTLENKKVLHEYSFEYKYIFDTLSKISKVTIFKDKSSVFRIINIVHDENYIAHLRDLSDSKIYYLNLDKNKLNIIKKDKFLWIYNYEKKEDCIFDNKLTTLEILEEDKMISFLVRYFYDKNITIFEVIDIDNGNITLINKKKEICKINNCSNLIKDYGINFCSIIIICNYNIKGNNEIEIIKDTFIYKFNEKSYYLKDILINSYAVLKFHFIDFEKDNNIFDSVYYDERTSIKIKNDIEYLVIDSCVDKIYDYYPVNLTLFNSTKEESKTITFTVYLYQSVMNKINVFLNTKSSKRYFYEYLIYNLEDELGKFEKKINIDNIEYNINISDSFGSLNRKRLSIMNIPYQDSEILEEEITGNSIQICELIKGKNKKIIGIFNIDFFEIEEISCAYFDNYYPSFGDIYDMIIEYNDKNSEKIMNTLIAKLKSINLKSLSESDNVNFNKVDLFENSMTLSQFKTRVGLIIIKYINDYINISDKKYLNEVITEISSMFEQIKDENFEFLEVIRILIFTLENILVRKSSSKIKLKLVSKLNSNSPYTLAYNFNKDQIKSLNEYSALFQAYLQLDSYQSFNYIHSMQTHNFSLELVFILKHQLLSNYNDFFYVKTEMNDENVYFDSNTKIVVINEYELFGPNFKEEEIIQNQKNVNDYAMSLSMNFLRENDGRYKYKIKNHIFNQSLIYFRGLKIELNISNYSSIIIGESGRIIENFICKNRDIIKLLSKVLIFGEFFKKEYFDQKDFKNLIKEVIQKYNSFQNKKNKTESKNYNINNIFNESKNSVKVGDIIIDVEKYKRNISITSDEKKASFQKYLQQRKKKLNDLRKRKVNNDN